MANETVIETQEQHDNAPQKENLWNGGQSPFKASYGKLMIWYFLLSDAFTFGGFLLAYGALRFSVKGWPVPDFVFQTAPFGISGAPLIFVTFMTFVLIVSSVTVLRAVQEGKRENQSAVVKWMLATVLGGALFLGCQAWEWTNLISTEGMTLYTNPFATHIDEGKYLTLDELNGIAKEKGWDKEVVSLESHGKTTEITYFTDAKGNKYFEKRDHHGDLPEKMDIQAGDSYLVTYQHDMDDYAVGAYKTTDGEIKTEAFGPQAFGALFFFITGFHGFHVFTGLAFLLIIAIQAANGTYVARKNGYEMVEKVGLYWHFVDLVWVFVFLAFYLL